MNKWVKNSIEIANAWGYLDDLSEIYPATLLPKRYLDNLSTGQIKRLHKQRKAKEIVIFLLGLTKKKHPFPIEHPYASLFRQKPELIKKNPEVFKKLGKIILSMPVKDVIKGCERPIDINRVMGQMFFNWLVKFFPSKGIPFFPEAKFDSFTGKAFLKGRDADISNYINQRFRIRLERGRDFLYKTGNKFVIGEARFLSTSGGSQTRDLHETITFIKKFKGKIKAVGVVDGIMWFNRSYVGLLKTLGKNEPALSILLLEKYLKSLG